MQHLFADYEVSLLAKNKGFTECCFQYFQHGVLTQSSYSEFIDFNTKYKNNNIISAPLWDQLIEWLDKKEIFCSADMRIEDGLFKWYPVIKEVEHYEEVRTELKLRGTKINALRDAILHALTLI